LTPWTKDENGKQYTLKKVESSTSQSTVNFIRQQIRPVKYDGRNSVMKLNNEINRENRSDTLEGEWIIKKKEEKANKCHK